MSHIFLNHCRISGTSSQQLILALPAIFRYLLVKSLSNITSQATVQYHSLEEEGIQYHAPNTQTFRKNYHVYIMKSTRTREYHFIRIYNPNCFHGMFVSQVKCKLKLYSWTQAHETCKGIGGQLPQFISRKDQEELLNLLKISTDLFAVEALFIGMYRHFQKR